MIHTARVPLFCLLFSSWLGAADCNQNGTEDADDIALAESADCNLDGVPDECQVGPLQVVMRPDTSGLRIGSLPEQVAVGDLDGDGLPDFVTTNLDDSLSVLRNRGAGRFELVGEKVAEYGGEAVRLADLDSDGHPDVVAGGDGGFSIFLGGNPDLLGDAVPVTESGDYRAFELLDLYGDGTLDIVASDRDSSTVLVLSGRGDGTFDDALRFPAGGRPTGLVTIDADSDGMMDVATGNDRDRNVTLLRNTGASLDAPVGFSTGGRPRLLRKASGENGTEDILGVVTSRVVRLRGQGDGTFAEVEMFYESPGNIIAFLHEDLDGDGQRDFLLALSGSATVRLARGRPGGGFFELDRIGVDGFTRQLEAADLDRDGDPDIVMLSPSQAVGILWQDSAGLIPLETVAIPPVVERPHSATSGDFDSDGLEDVITANGSDRGISLFRNLGDGTLADVVTTPTNGYLNSIAALDVEGDGDLDVVSVDPKSDVLLVLRNLDGQGGMGELVVFPAGREPFMIEAGDVDEDGDPDVVIANASEANVSILANDGEGAYSMERRIRTGSRPVAVAVAELSGDAHLDIAVSNSAAQTTTVMLGLGDGMFQDAVNYPAPGTTLYVEPADLDGDSDLDLVSANEATSDRVSVLTNTGDGSFIAGGFFDSAQVPYSLLADDINADGLVDVVTANQPPNSVSVLEGSGDGSFSGVSVYPVGEDPRFVMAVDLDRDGDKDLVAANHTSRDLTVLRNFAVESLFRGDFLERICTGRDFDSISVPARLPAARSAKYILPAREEEDLLPPLFQNVSRYRLHQEFLAAVFPDRFPALPPQEYNQLVGRRATRRYFVGVVDRLLRPDGVAYGFNVVTDASDPQELLTVDEVRGVWEAMSEVFALEPLGYAPDTTAAREAAAAWGDPGFPVYLDEEEDDLEYEAYTAAVGYGRVRLLDAEGFERANETGEASFQSILVLAEAPRDIEGVVGGVITAQRQGELSHVAIRTARRGTPNAFVADATAAFQPFEGKLVRLEVRTGGYEVEEASLEDAEAFWAQNRPTLSELPALDGEWGQLSSLAEIAMMDLVEAQEIRFGGKATNLARLGRTFQGSEFERYRERGFAIPVRYYLEFLRSNTIASFLDAGREVTYEEYLRELFASADFQSDSTLRFRKLAEFRDVARDDGVVDEELVQAILARLGEVFPSTSTPVRFRSSSNVEDALEFNGAGLYESTGGCADDDLDDDEEGPSLCDPSKGSERGVRRALKKVWTSLFTFRAFEERAFYGIPEERVAMGILVSRAFPDELANGVAFTGNISNPLDRRYVVTVQLGEESVVHPDPGVLPEKDVLEIEAGRVSRIVRPLVGSTLVEPGTWVLSDEHLSELGAVLAFVDANFPIDLGDYRREEVLLDLEFKLEPDDTLAFKQVRPFLLSEAPPPAPEFALVVPDDFSICAVFGVAGGDRGPRDEYLTKSTLRLRAGTIPLPTGAGSIEADLIDELVFGREREVAQPAGSGRFSILTIPRPDGTTAYRFNFEQTFTLEGGSVLEIRGVVPLEFLAREGEVLSDPLEFSEAFFTVLAGREAIQGSLDGDPLIRYGSCEYPSLARWEVSAELVDGTAFTLEERYEEAESLNDTAPATIVRATVDIGGERRVVTDYFDLVYSAFRHNTGVRYWVVLDPPVELDGLAAPVHVLEYMAAEPTQGVQAAANYRDAQLEVIGSPALRASARRPLLETPVPFRRGDVNADGSTNITDGVRLLEFLFRSGEAPSCLASADVDGSDRLNLVDAIRLLSFITRPDAPAPVPPRESCGVQEDSSTLSCGSFPACPQ